MSNNVIPATMTAIACLLLMAFSFTLGKRRAGWFSLLAAVSFWVAIMLHGNDIIGVVAFAALSVAWWLMFEPLAPKEKRDESRNSDRPSQRH